MPKIILNIDDLHRKYIEENEVLKGKLSHAVRKMSDEQKSVIATLTGDGSTPPQLLASDMEARLEASKEFTRILESYRTPLPFPEPWRGFFLTFCDSGGDVSDRAPIAPYKPLRDKVYKAIKATGLNAIVVTEVHALMNYPAGGMGRTLLYHAHAFAWTSKSTDAKQIALQLRKVGVWKNSLGAPPIDVRPVGDTPEDRATLAYYMFKSPSSAKNRRPLQDKPGEHRFINTIRGYRPELALRTMEGLSQIQLMDTVFGVNQGSQLRQQLNAAMKKWHKGRPESPLPKDFDAWRFWLDLRKEHGSAKYLPYRFDGCGGLPAKPPRTRRNKVTGPGKKRRLFPSLRKKPRPISL